MYWWGSKERADRTLKANSLYTARNPSITIEGETLGWGDYWPRMATQAAGRNLPDVIQMGYGVMLEYVNKGTLKPLDEAIAAGKIDTTKVDPSGIAAGTFNGQVYGLTIGANAQATCYNKRIFEEAGIEVDPITWTYDDLKALSIKISEKGGPKGTDDLTAEKVFDILGDDLTRRGIEFEFPADPMTDRDFIALLTNTYAMAPAEYPADAPLDVG